MTKGKQPLPKHLEWVYIYIGKNSKEVGYVGRAKNSSRVEKRVVEHRKEAWYWSEEWELKFCPCLNRCESEYLETIYINKLHAKYNKDKVGWGVMLDNLVADLDDLPGINCESNIYFTTYGGQLKNLLEKWEKEIKGNMLASGDFYQKDNVVRRSELHLAKNS